MCFSAAVSFTAAGVIGAVGVATLAQKPEPKRLAFALIPLFFALHQLIEGFIWLSVGAGAEPSAFLTVAYLFLAQVFWPTYTPLSVLLIEQDKRRRWALMMLLAVGLIVSGVLGGILIGSEYTVRAVSGSLSYTTDHQFEKRLLELYLLATAAPLLISRHRYVMAFGGVILIGSIVTQLAFYYAAASVWCFFAAIGSPLVFLHVRRQARLARG